MQVLTMDGFVVVTTPQELAKIDAKRSINMIRKLKVNVLGVVENMSGGIFGKGAGKEISKELELYNILQNKKTNNSKKAEDLLEIVIDARKKLLSRLEF